MQDDSDTLEAFGREVMRALSWSADNGPDWESFRTLFHPDARLVPAARPAAPIPVDTFIERMDAQRESGSLRDFQEQQVSLRVHRFGNVANLFQTFRTIVNHGEPGYGTSAMVWIRDEDTWKCITMAWDAQTNGKKIPEHYFTN